MGDVSASIIIRTRDEEAWIGHCLNMVFKQHFTDFEVILVDNRSTDHSVQVARRFPVREVLALDDFLPGRALNLGIAHARGEFIVCLSAHCIPLDERWLGSLLDGFGDPRVAGVYGRQLPLPFSTPADRRDLLTVFGVERRVQERDYFFHNANSALRRAVLERIPFDPTVRHLEDRHWGKRAIAAGHRLVYEPEAAVYHHHGINQGNDPERARGVSAVLDTVAGDTARDLPEVLKPHNSNVAAVIPVRGAVRSLRGHPLLPELLGLLQAARYVRGVYLLGEAEELPAIARGHGATFLARPEALRAPQATLGDVLRHALAAIEAAGDYPDALLSVNYLYPFRPPGLFDELVVESRYKGLDTVFPAYVDYSDHWTGGGDGSVRPLGTAAGTGLARPRVFRSLYGLGCVSAAPVVRRGRHLGERAGIVAVHEHIYTLRCTDHPPAGAPPLAGRPSAAATMGPVDFLSEFRP